MNLKEQILALHSLETNWDGEGAEHVDAHSIYEALQFVDKLNPKGLYKPTLFGIPISGDMFEAQALAQGTVGLIHNDGGSGLFIDLEFLKDRRIAYFVKRDGHSLRGVM